MGLEKQDSSDQLAQAATQHHMGARDACRLQRWGDSPEEQSASLRRALSAWQKAEVFEGEDEIPGRAIIALPS